MSRIEDFESTVDLMQVLLWQYNDAVRLQKIIELKQLWYDKYHTDFWINWERDVFDLRTANDFGLSVWAIILDVPLSFEVPASSETKVAWGFGSRRKNFNNGNFKRSEAGAVILTTEQRRIVLRLRYFQLTTSGNVLEINKFLLSLFGEDYGLVYVRDNLDMSCTYIFSFNPPSQLQLVLDQFDILPRPTAVSFDYIVDLDLPFGFENRANYNNGNFAPYVPPQPTNPPFEVNTSFSNSYGGVPTIAGGTGWGVTGGSATISSFTGTVSPGTIDGFSGIGVGYVLDGGTSDLYFLLFLDGADGSENYNVSGDGINGTLNTLDASFEATNYGNAFIWNVGTGSAPAPWNSENTFGLTIVAA